ncbi:MAG: roadblock/LC7 domain-containing protein [Promethearchaeota archaeon]
MSENILLTQLEGLVKDFTKSQNDVQGQIVIAFPAGVPIANTWKGNIDPILVGAVSAAVKLTFQNLCMNLKKGLIKRIIVNSEMGRIIIQKVGERAILTTIIAEEADIFRIAFGISNLAIKIKNLFKNFKGDLDDLLFIDSKIK